MNALRINILRIWMWGGFDAGCCTDIVCLCINIELRSCTVAVRSDMTMVSVVFQGTIILNDRMIELNLSVTLRMTPYMDHVTALNHSFAVRLPVRQRVAFKRAVLVWKYLQGEAPRYLADLCVPAASTDGHHQSRSAVSGALLVPWTRTSTSQRMFACSRTWNRLPAAFRSPGLNLHAFKRQLKAHLFQH